MFIPHRGFALLALPLVMCACSAQPTPQERIEAQERAQLNAFKAAYSDTIAGFDIHGNSLDVSIDMESFMSMSTDDDETIRRAALASWKRAWAAAHPGQHEKLVVRLIDFRGNVDSTRSINA